MANGCPALVSFRQNEVHAASDRDTSFSFQQAKTTPALSALLATFQTSSTAMRATMMAPTMVSRWDADCYTTPSTSSAFHSGLEVKNESLCQCKNWHVHVFNLCRCLNMKRPNYVPQISGHIILQLQILESGRSSPYLPTYLRKNIYSWKAENRMRSHRRAEAYVCEYRRRDVGPLAYISISCLWVKTVFVVWKGGDI